jgi:hypothetical protein
MAALFFPLAKTSMMTMKSFEGRSISVNSGGGAISFSVAMADGMGCHDEERFVDQTRGD